MLKSSSTVIVLFVALVSLMAVPPAVLLSIRRVIVPLPSMLVALTVALLTRVMFPLLVILSWLLVFCNVQFPFCSMDAVPVPSRVPVVRLLSTLRPREFSAERDVIIEALMSPFPRNRIKNKAPSKNILDAADDLRRLEILYDLNLITERERQAERKAIEKYLGIDNSPKQPEPAVVTTPAQTQAVTSQASTTEISQTKPAEESKTPENANPNVSSPF